MGPAVFIQKMMSQPPGKLRQPKAGQLKLVAKNPRKVKIALKSWIEASDKVDSDPMGLDAAPPWVERAWAEVLKVIMPSNRLPMSGEVDLEMLGELFGRMQALSKLYSGEIPLTPEVQTEWERCQQHLASQPQTPESKANGEVLARDFQTRVGAVQPSIPHLVNAALASSHEDSLKFQTGLLRGMNLSSDDLLSANVFERHTRTFYVLALMWRFWVTCKSLHEVHQHLCKSMGEKKIGGFKTFENRVAKKIGLKVRGRGRPCGNK
jgi:hypothetical protein